MKKQSRFHRSNPAVWRWITLFFSLALLVSLFIPGTLVYYQSIDAEDYTYASYAFNRTGLPQTWIVVWMAVFSVFCAARAIRKEKDAGLPLLIFIGVALFFMVGVELVTPEGFLPYLPPALAIAVAFAALRGWDLACTDSSVRKICMTISFVFSLLILWVALFEETYYTPLYQDSSSLWLCDPGGFLSNQSGVSWSCVVCVIAGFGAALTCLGIFKWRLPSILCNCVLLVAWNLLEAITVFGGWCLELLYFLCIMALITSTAPGVRRHKKE